MNSQEKRKFRYENKYIITTGQKELISNHIEVMCNLDKYSIQNRGYNIRSLYFDDYHSTAYYDNETGVDKREKYRIRIYNCSKDIIILERKIKVNGRISKDRAVISLAFLNAVLEERVFDLDFNLGIPLVNRFLTAYHTRYLRPRIIVDYEREAYVSEVEDLRITFDKGISFSSNVKSFLEPELSLQPIMPCGKDLLEVKYTEVLPEYIYKELNQVNIQQSTFSKYYLCEKIRREGEY